MNKFIALLFISIFSFCTYANAERTTYTINELWKFMKSDKDASATNFDDSKWKIVSIPHSWNSEDATNETPGYFRGQCWYRKNVTIDKNLENLTSYIVFEGANQEVEVFINGTSVGSHKGGYTNFTFDISKQLHKGDNTIAVMVNNEFNANIPPLTADFTFFGGIYRDIYLTFTPKVHINSEFYASSGVFITTPKVNEKEASLVVTTKVKNDSKQSQKIIVENVILDPQGNEVTSTKEKLTLNKDTDITSNLSVKNPILWDTENPNLYHVHTRILDNSGEIIDDVVSQVGLRWFSFDTEKGFFLNGKHLKLMGTCRHQCYFEKGNALNDEMHVRDIKLLKEMGGNFLRISHYPQDPVIIEMCDKLGIITSIEIPLVNYITMSDEFLENSLNMAKEMVYQNFNSPSIVMWAYMNEIMLRPPYNTDKSIDIPQYFKYTEKIAATIDKTIKDIDPYRYTMMACHSNANIYEEVGLTAIPDILGWNLYNGWYSGSFSGFEAAVDKLHERFPDKVLLITEYGADVDPRLHSFDSERFDFSCEYGVKYHKHYIPEILKRDFLAGTNIWNLNDFHSELRHDAVPFINNKGITGTNRERKDSYHLYKAYLSKKPVLKIGNATWKNRAAVGENGIVEQEIDVYTNASQVTLHVNGEIVGTAKVNEHCASFTPKFTHGENVIMATATINSKTITTTEVINFNVIPKNLKSDKIPFTEMSVMLGSKRYFEDRDAETCWIPEQEYTPGSWGYVGGEAVKTKTRFGSLPNSDIDVLGTTNDPIYQTQREGLSAFIADVPNGKYSVYLYLCELQSNKEREALAYNLGNDAIAKKFEVREFNISINGINQISNLDITQQFGAEKAIIKKFVVNVTDNKGLKIEFDKVVGEPVLNAIKIYKNY